MDERRATVLIVDDEPLNLEVLESFLYGVGYRIVRASSGEDALASVKAEQPDLVLLDVMMPGMDGFEVCRRLKGDDSTRSIPVVIVTSLDQRDDKVQAIKVGADDFITKPVDKTELLARSASLLRMKEFHDERDKAYSDIRRITVFFNDAVRSFDPMKFSLDQAYNAMFSTILGRPGNAMGQPSHALVIPYGTKGLSEGTLYYYDGRGSLMQMQLHLDHPQRLVNVLGYEERRDVFVNLPQAEDGVLPDSLHREAGPVVNLASCYSGDILVVCINYGRAVGIHDLHVLKDLALHSLFFDTLSGQVKENEEAFLYTIKALARAAEVNDEDTGSHIIRVNEYSYEIAAELGIPARLVAEIRYSAQMHDVGKLHAPSELLKKAGMLTPEEWVEVKKHTIYGPRILGGSPRLETARQIAQNHHERWDGSGYPNGLKGEQIPLAARIVSVCDVYDALRNRRVYKQAIDHATTCRIMTEGDGRTMPGHFDPQVLDIFRRITGRFEEIYLEFNDAH